MKSVFITGANGGLGLETAKLLAQEKLERFVLGARTLAKSEYAKNEVEKNGGVNANLETAGGFDMTNVEAIEKAVEALPKNKPFDTIFFQVGGVFFTDAYQYQNYNGLKIEKTVFQNVIGSYVTLTNLEKAGLVAKNARIVFAGGEGARGIPGMIEKPVFTPQEFRNYVFGRGDQKKYNPMNAIGVSKLSSALLVQKLAQMKDGNTYVWFTPGLTHGTNGLKEVKGIKRFFMETVAFGITGLLGLSQSPKKGAQKYFDSLTGKYGKNGDVLGSPEGKVLGKIVDQLPMNTSLGDKNMVNEFWDILNQVYPYNASKVNLKSA
jgi:NAD(P)-dependent dehydrogenase (short-subunit alcohol dehydrogenase family)